MNIWLLDKPAMETPGARLLEMYSGKDTNTRQTVLKVFRLWEKAT